MADDEFTQDLFRFLQLLCEGHNNGEEEGRVGEWMKRRPGFGVSLEGLPELNSRPLPPYQRWPHHSPWPQLSSILYFQPLSSPAHPPS